MTALVASWVLILLTVVSVTFGHEVSAGLREARWNQERAQLEAYARAGVEFSRRYLEPQLRLAVVGQLEDTSASVEATRWARDQLLRDVAVGEGHFTLGYLTQRNGKATTEYGLVDENRKVPLDLLDDATLRSLPGLTPAAVAILQEIRQSQREADDLTVDLSDLPGLDEAGRTTLRELVTSHASHVNINTATAGSLTALGIPSAGAEKIVRYRNGADGEPFTSDDSLFTDLENPEGGLRECRLDSGEAAAVSFLASAGYLDTRSDTFRIRSRGWTNPIGAFCEIETVVRFEGDGWEVRTWTQNWNG